MDKYRTVKTLGDGTFGTVYKATNIHTGELVAIKKMKQKYTNWNECIDSREIRSLRKLGHPNIIKLKEVLLVADELYMVFEYLDYNLYEVYSKMKTENKRFTEREIKSMVFQICHGLAHMHKNGFFHRDMKPENLLIYNNVVKVCDLGLAREIRSKPPFTDYVSTRWYRAPQLLLRSTVYNSPVDIFALGCIMAELYTLTPLFAGLTEVDQLNKMIKVLGTPRKDEWPEGYKLAQSKGYYFPDEKGVSLGIIVPEASPQGLELIESMLQYNSRKRPTAAQLLKHDFFKGITLPQVEAPLKQVVFEEKPQGAKLDTAKQDKNIDHFRATKEKFKQTRKHDALESNPFKVIENKSKVYDDPTEDLDTILRELEEEKNRKKKQRLPFINTRDKFNPPKQQNKLRESKTEMKHGQPYKYLNRDEWREIDRSPPKAESRKNPPSKGQPPKFSYGFQPAFNPVFLPQSKNSSNSNKGMNNIGGLGFLPLGLPSGLPSAKPLPKVAAYKF